MNYLKQSKKAKAKQLKAQKKLQNQQRGSAYSSGKISSKWKVLVTIVALGVLEHKLALISQIKPLLAM